MTARPKTPNALSGAGGAGSPGVVRQAGRGDVVGAVAGAIVGSTVVVLCRNDAFLREANRRWAVIAIVVVAVAVGACLGRLARIMPWPGALTAVLLVTLAAMYGCVPETDQIPPVAAILVIVGLLEVALRRSFHPAGSTPAGPTPAGSIPAGPLLAWLQLAWIVVAAALVLWAGVYGTAGYDRAFIGGLFAFWPVVLVAVVGLVFPQLARAATLARLLVFGLGAAAALVVARTGALQPGRRPALRDAAIWGGATLVAGLFVGWLATRARRAHQRA